MASGAFHHLRTNRHLVQCVVLACLAFLVLPMNAAWAPWELETVDWLNRNPDGPPIGVPVPVGLVRVEINQMDGHFEFSSSTLPETTDQGLTRCGVAFDGFLKCTDPLFEIGAFNNQGSQFPCRDIFVDGSAVTGECRLVRYATSTVGTHENGSGPVQIQDPNGCTTFSFSEYPGVAEVVLVDALGVAWMIDTLSWQGAGYQPLPGADQWFTNAVTLSGLSRTSGGATKRLTLSLTGLLTHIPANCPWGGLDSGFQFSIGGGGNVS